MQATRRHAAAALLLCLLLLAGCGGARSASKGDSNLPQPNSPSDTAPAPGPAPAPVTPSAPAPGTPTAPAPAPAPGTPAAPAPGTPAAPSSGADSAAPPPPPSPSPAPVTPPPAPRPLRDVSIILDWYPNAVHTFLYAAAEQGYFAQEGLRVSFKMPPNDPTDGLKLVAAGKETFCIYYQPDTLVARAQDIPVVSVAAIVRHPLDVLMAPAALGVRSPRDLVGRTVGYPTIPTDISYVSVMVAGAGGDPSKVRFQDVGYDLIAAITTRRVDAIIGGYINHEKLVLEKQGIPMTVLRLQDFGVPDYYELVLLTAEKTLNQDPEMVRAFWRAAGRGFDWVKAHPKEAIDMLMRLQAQEYPLEKDVETRSLQILLPLMDDGSARFGAQSRDGYVRLGVWLGLEGVLPKSVDADKAFVNLTP